MPVCKTGAFVLSGCNFHRAHQFRSSVVKQYHTGLLTREFQVRILADEPILAEGWAENHRSGGRSRNSQSFSGRADSSLLFLPPFSDQPEYADSQDSICFTLRLNYPISRSSKAEHPLDKWATLERYQPGGLFELGQAKQAAREYSKAV